VEDLSALSSAISAGCFMWLVEVALARKIEVQIWVIFGL